MRTHTHTHREMVFAGVHNERESQDEYLNVCVFMCVCFNSYVSLQTPQWRHPRPPDSCLTGYM